MRKASSRMDELSSVSPTCFYQSWKNSAHCHLLVAVRCNDRARQRTEATRHPALGHSASGCPGRYQSPQRIPSRRPPHSAANLIKAVIQGSRQLWHEVLASAGPFGPSLYAASALGCNGHRVLLFSREAQAEMQSAQVESEAGGGFAQIGETRYPETGRLRWDLYRCQGSGL